jgi:hypothetical protein
LHRGDFIINRIEAESLQSILQGIAATEVDNEQMMIAIKLRISKKARFSLHLYCWSYERFLLSTLSRPLEEPCA